jgi:hypothetical protein
MAAAATPRARECAAPPAYGWSRRKRDWLLFLHADTRLPEGALARIESLNCRAGAFRHRFDSRDWRLRFISWATNLRCGMTRIFDGDQAIFVRRELFSSLGGFPEVSALEEILFCKRLVRHTRPVLLEDCILTDARRGKK